MVNTHMLLYRKLATVVRPQQSPRAALSRPEPIHFMPAKGFIAVIAFGTVNDWLASMDVSYNHPIN